MTREPRYIFWLLLVASFREQQYVLKSSYAELAHIFVSYER